MMSSSLRRCRTPAAVVLLVMAAGCSAGDGLDSDDVTAANAVDAAERSATEQDDGAVLNVEGDEPLERPVVEIPDSYPSAIEAVYGRYWLYWEAYAAAHGPPNADPTYEPLRRLATPRNWASLQEELREFSEDGIVLSLPRKSVTEHLIRLPNASVLTGEEGEEVVLQDCWIDDFAQRTLDGRVLVATKEAKLMNVTMKVVDGEWRVDGVTRATAESDGFTECLELTPS